MKFYYQNIVDSTVSYSGTADTNYPEDNVVNVRKNLLFKDTNFIGITELDIDLKSSRTCNYIILDNCSFSGLILAMFYSTDNTIYICISICYNNRQKVKISFSNRSLKIDSHIFIY